MLCHVTKLSRESEYQHHFISPCKQQDENQFAISWTSTQMKKDDINEDECKPLFSCLKAMDLCVT